MTDLPPGTVVEVWRTKLVHELCVVTNSDPLILRPATLWEQARAWLKSRQTRAKEISASAEAIEAIERAKEKQT